MVQASGETPGMAASRSASRYSGGMAQLGIARCGRGKAGQGPASLRWAKVALRLVRQGKGKVTLGSAMVLQS